MAIEHIWPIFDRSGANCCEPAFKIDLITALKTQGYDFDKIVQRVAELLDMPKAEVVSAGKRRSVVKARSIVCYWAHRRLGINQTELARKFGLSQPAVCAAVRNGQKIVQELQLELAKDKL
jgi:putative transposase